MQKQFIEIFGDLYDINKIIYFKYDADEEAVYIRLKGVDDVSEYYEVSQEQFDQAKQWIMDYTANVPPVKV